MSRYINFMSLLFKLLYPFKLLRLLVGLSVLAFFLAMVAQWVLGWEWVFVVAAVGMCVALFPIVITLPSQVIALASNRPVSLLGNVRRDLLLCQVVVCLSLGIIICWLFSFTPFWQALGSPFLVLWLMVSVLMQFNTWVCSRWPGVHGLIFMFNMLFDDLARWLGGFHPVSLVMFLIASWAIFSSWWFRWQPTKYQANMLLWSVREVQAFQAERQVYSRWLSGPARSWVGARLAGMSDGWISISKRILLIVLLFSLILVPCYLLLSAEQLQDLILMGSRFMVIVIGIVAHVVATGFYRNLRSIWLFSSVSREQLFFLLFREYWRWISPWSLLFIVIVVIAELAFAKSANIINCFLLFGSTLLFQVLLFHVILFVYQKTSASFNACTWAGMSLFIVWFYTVCAAGLIFPLPFNWQGISSFWLFLPEIAALLLLHKRVRSGFASMNLLRIM